MHQLAAALCVLASASQASGSAPTKIAVLPVQLDTSAEGRVPSLVDDYVLTAAQKIGTYKVIGQDDINALIGFEQQKDLFGCDDATCFADIGGALGVGQLLIIKIAKLEAEWAVTGKVIDIRESAVLTRSSDFVKGDTRQLLEAITPIVRELLGAEPTAPALAGKQVGPEDAPEAKKTDEATLSGDAYYRKLMMPEDWARYQAYNAGRSPAVPPAAWIETENEESTALLVAELGSLGFGLVSAGIGAGTGEETVTPVLFVAGLLTAGVLTLIDLFDVGALELRE